MSGEETFLESFVEHISDLPSDIRRNLDLVKDLDKSSSDIVVKLRAAEEAYVQRAEQTVLNLTLPTRKRKRGVGTASEESNGDDDEEGDVPKKTGDKSSRGVDDIDSDILVPTTEELRGRIMNPAELEMIARLRREAMQQSEEKVVVAEQTYALIDETVKRLDGDLSKFEALLKVSGAFEVAGGAKPNDLAAIQVNPNSADWILAKVISQDVETGMYQLADEDVESNKVFNLPESQVVVLGGVDRLSRGDIIYAVYPDTTSFYQATVVQIPKKVGGGDSFIMVHFKDDSDEHGITHDKAVSMQHVMRVPYSSY
mmetsp:Transcript_12797/g.27095  ORF Transcript_12797/g.27095 Transcript_12797/m.27095 type:complete len:313 (-) Transcript_12797:246-1184(-)